MYGDKDDVLVLRYRFLDSIKPQQGMQMKTQLLNKGTDNKVIYLYIQVGI
jgi:hypothetical protein